MLFPCWKSEFSDPILQMWDLYLEVKLHIVSAGDRADSVLSPFARWSARRLWIFEADRCVWRHYDVNINQSYARLYRCSFVIIYPIISQRRSEFSINTSNPQAGWERNFANLLRQTISVCGCNILRQLPYRPMHCIRYGLVAHNG